MPLLRSSGVVGIVADAFRLAPEASRETHPDECLGLRRRAAVHVHGHGLDASGTGTAHLVVAPSQPDGWPASDSTGDPTRPPVSTGDLADAGEFLDSTEEDLL
ncbi:hypothetical protein [Salinigranum halophilum]|uniref:hypothetical protein n=1 Tax=Salinigranum halophilum TaxID=2565931 RepID=UPI0010A940F8|nr:hypothetical protein [Salinigranum halophilum]